MGKEGMSGALVTHESFEKRRVEKISKNQESEKKSWEQREADHNLDQLARELLKNSGLIELAKEHAEKLVKNHGSISSVPNQEFVRFEDEYGYDPVLVKKVFALYTSEQKHKKVA